MNNILVFAAHPDDELLGEGGTIRRLVNEGCTARAVILAEGITSRSKKRDDTDKTELIELQNDSLKASKIIGYTSVEFCGFPDNRMDSVDLLNIIKTISHYIDLYKPDTVFTHHHGDLNIDHKLTCEAVLTACRPVGDYSVKRIFAFETPSSSEWNFNYYEPFKPNVFFDVTDTIQSKIDGMACYRSESTTYPHPRSSEALLSLASLRGTSIGVDKAEAFELLFETV